MEFIIPLILLIPFVMLTVIGCCYTYLWVIRQKAEIYNVRTRYTPDCRGNYDGYFDPTNNISFSLDPGNKAYADNVYIINSGQGGRAGATRQLPIVNRWTDYTPSQTAEVEISEPSEPSEPGERLPVSPAQYQQLIEAKRKGLPQSCITSITGATKSGNPNSLYQQILALWKGIQ